MRTGRGGPHPELCFRTSAALPGGELQPDAAVELQGDESVGRHHDDAGDEEEQQQQGHVPATGPEKRRLPSGDGRRIRRTAEKSHPGAARIR